MSSYGKGFRIVRKRRRILLGKYADLVDQNDLQNGIFRYLKNNPTSRSEIARQVAVLESLKVLCWGNHKRGICGVGNPLRNIYKKPEEVVFPKGERIWYIAHSHEHLTGAISLSGKCYSWGDSSPFVSGNKGFETTPVEGMEFNRTLEKALEIPIYIGAGHSVLAILTHSGKVYFCTTGKFERIEIKHKVEHLFCNSFAFRFVVHKPNDLGTFVGSYEKWRKTITYRKIELKKKEKVRKLDGGYSSCMVLTNFRIIDPSRSILSTGYVNDVVDISAAYSHLLVTRDGSLHGKGNNVNGELHNVDNMKCIAPGFGRITLSKLENLKVIAVSNGTDYSSPGGHTLFLDHKHFLYHMGNNRCGEHLEDPTMKKKDHFPPKKIPVDNVLVFNANENYCSVICYEKHVLTHFRMNLVVAREFGVQCDVRILTKFY